MNGRKSDPAALALVGPTLLEVKAPTTPAASVATWGPGIEWVAPGSLSDHPIWHALLGFESPEKEDELIGSVRAHKVIDPILVTGEGCASRRARWRRGRRPAGRRW